MTTAEFIQQYNQHLNALTGFAHKLCGDREEANDIVQDAAIRAFNSRHRLESSSAFKGWAYTIVKNTYINKFNKRTRRRKLMDHAPRRIRSKAQATTSNEGISKLRLDTIMNRISDINPIYKRPFFLHYKGYSYEEIAERINAPIGTVKSRIFTAKKKMRSKLAPLVAA